MFWSTKETQSLYQLVAHQAGQNVSISPRTVSCQCLPNFRMTLFSLVATSEKNKILLCVATEAEIAHTVNLRKMEDGRPTEIERWRVQDL